MIRSYRGWADREEPNRRWTAVPPAIPYQKCDASWALVFDPEFVVEELNTVSVIGIVAFDPVDVPHHLCHGSTRAGRQLSRSRSVLACFAKGAGFLRRIVVPSADNKDKRLDVYEILSAYLLSSPR